MIASRTKSIASQRASSRERAGNKQKANSERGAGNSYEEAPSKWKRRTRWLDVRERRWSKSGWTETHWCLFDTGIRPTGGSLPTSVPRGQRPPRKSTVTSQWFSPNLMAREHDPLGNPLSLGNVALLRTMRHISTNHAPPTQREMSCALDMG